MANGIFDSAAGGTAAVYADGTNGANGINGNSDTGDGVSGASETGIGVVANCVTGIAVSAYSNSHTGVFATSGTGIGVHAIGGGATGTLYGEPPGETMPPTAPPLEPAAIFAEGGPGIGVVATSNTTGVHGSGAAGAGVWGTSTGYDGVHGESSAAQHAGVSGTNTAGGIGTGSGVYGSGAAGAGVWGTSTGYDGVHGESSAARHAGVSGTNTDGGIGVFGNSSGNAGQFEGNVLVTGTINVGGDVVLQNADCAEDFDVAESDLAVGTVVVMSSDGNVRPCDADYATTVVGVVSGAGGLRPGITLDRRESATPRIPIALMGKVYCKADAASSPINMGDLLTTSETRGHAMKASDPSRAFGSVIGKALGPLAEGQGLIPVLVALQ
jgi:hypothetical protein